MITLKFDITLHKIVILKKCPDGVTYDTQKQRLQAG